MSKNITFNSDKIEKHRDLATKIKGGLVVVDGKIQDAEGKSPYLDNLPEGITKEDVEKVLGYNDKFIVAAHVAVGELAGEAFIENKGLESIRSKVNMGNNSAYLLNTITKEKSFKNNFAKEGEDPTIVKHLHITGEVVVGGRGLKGVKDSMQELFKDYL